MAGTNINKAYFLVQYALEINWKFQNALYIALRDSNFLITGGCKTNLMRIEDKMCENIIEEDDEECRSFRIYDMIRTTIIINEP